MAAYAYWHSNLLGSWALQIYFVGLQALGWWRWRAHSRADLRTSSKRCSRDEIVAAGGVLVLAWIGVSSALHFAGASLPWFDGLVTSLSLIAQLGLVFGRVESWLVWIVADVLYVGLSGLSGMWAFAFAYAIYTAIAVSGWNQWTRESALTTRTAPHGDT